MNAKLIPDDLRAYFNVVSLFLSDICYSGKIGKEMWKYLCSLSFLPICLPLSILSSSRSRIMLWNVCISCEFRIIRYEIYGRSSLWSQRNIILAHKKTIKQLLLNIPYVSGSFLGACNKSLNKVNKVPTQGLFLCFIKIR